jgi:hypothetical protein
MKTRNQIHLAIGLGAIALALVWPIHIDAKPMVECKDGKCVIAEDDWKRFQEFHRQVRIQMEAINEAAEAQNKQMYGLMGQLAACNSRIPQKEI